MYIDLEHPVEPWLQLISDELQTALSVRAVTFHSVHLFLLNVFVKWRQKHVLYGVTINEYLPVGFDVGKTEESEEYFTNKSKRISRVLQFRVLHQSADHATKHIEHKHWKAFQFILLTIFVCNVILMLCPRLPISQALWRC